jgi:hypothetical protein
MLHGAKHLVRYRDNVASAKIWVRSGWLRQA